jgi:hypothetical protein
MQRTNSGEEQELLDLLGQFPVGRRAAISIAIEVARHMLESSLVAHSDAWVRAAGSDRHAATYLRDILEEEADLDNARIMGEGLLPLFRRINASSHESARTAGGARMVDTVERLQGGAFCVACGELEDLHVDHIESVSTGGDQQSSANLQLLCSDCNLGKGSFSDRLLPAMLRGTTDVTPSKAVRYRVLADSMDKSTGRHLGKCACGRTSKDTRLFVCPRSNWQAANYIQLQVICTECQGALLENHAD